MFHTLRFKLLVGLGISVLAFGASRAGPEQLLNTVPVELIEMVKPGVYTQRTVQMEFFSDATATVCVRGLDVPKMSSTMKCFMRMHGSTEVIVLVVKIQGEVKA